MRRHRYLLFLVSQRNHSLTVFAPFERLHVRHAGFVETPPLTWARV